jgi:hypothetical protein
MIDEVDVPLVEYLVVITADDCFVGLLGDGGPPWWLLVGSTDDAVLGRRCP